MLAADHRSYPKLGGFACSIAEFSSRPVAQACPVPRSFCDDRVRILQADARELRPVDLVSMHSVHSAAVSPWSGGFHAVLSDMCHSTVGNSAADVLRSLELAQTAAAIAVGDREERDEKESLEEWYSTGPAGRLCTFEIGACEREVCQHLLIGAASLCSSAGAS